MLCVTAVVTPIVRKNISRLAEPNRNTLVSVQFFFIMLFPIQTNFRHMKTQDLQGKICLRPVLYSSRRKNRGTLNLGRSQCAQTENNFL